MSGEDEEDKPPRSAPMRKSIRILLLILSVVLFLTFAYFLYYSNPNEDTLTCYAKDRKVPGGPSAEARSTSYLQLPVLSPNGENENIEKGKCNLFSGRWECDPQGPAYTNSTCQTIEAPQNCMRNGRPDMDYLYWRWKPNGCELPPFDPYKFLAAMKDKSWAFVGDSIFRNHLQSMVCLLTKVEEPVMIYHDKSFKSRTWYFSAHNFTVAVIWSPFLVKYETSADDEGNTESETQLHLDIIDEKWTDQYDKYDYIIFSGGQWFLKTIVLFEHNTIVGCHNCKKPNIKELGIDYSYRRALQTAYKFLTSSDHKPIIFFRTWTPDHFEHGEWFSGGVCNRTGPYREGRYNGKPTDHVMRRLEVEEFQKAMNSGNGARLKMLDTFHLSLLRPDGHPGPYRHFHPFDKDTNGHVQYDCLHWCLPGPIDSWNELIMKILIDEGDISYPFRKEI